ETQGDPLFIRHAEAARFWAVAAARLAESRAVPHRYARYADRILDFLQDLADKADPDAIGVTVGPRLDLDPARAQAERLGHAAGRLELRVDRALAADAAGVGDLSWDRLNDGLVAVESDFIG